MNSKKRILIIINSLTAGGAENQVANTLQLLKNDFDFHVLTILKNDDEFIKNNIDTGSIKIYPLNFPQKPVYFPLAFFKMLAVAKKIKPDLVHGVLFYANILSRWMKFFRKYKTVNSIYDISEEPAFKLWFLKHTNSRADRIFIDNNAGRINYTKKKITRPDQIAYTPNGIDFNEEPSFDKQLQENIRQKINYRKEDKLWLNVSRFAVQKDHRTLVEAFTLLVKEDPGNKLLLVGDGALAEEIINLVQEKEMQNNIFYLGRINDIYTICRLSGQYVCSSAWEGMPIIIMQAMLFGLPVVSTGVGAIPDLIEDNVTGYLCERRDPQSLFNAMKKMNATLPEQRILMSERARKKIKEEFSLEKLKQNWFNNYNNVLNGN